MVYHNDAIARERNLTPQDRLELHQAQSGPTMDELHGWLHRQFDDRLVEPNSSLGKAIAYMLNHWQRLTLFLRVPGAPLGRVEKWRGGLGAAYLFPALSFAGASLASPCSVSTSRSSNRRADFPHPALFQDIRFSHSARPRDWWTVGTAPASDKDRRRDTVCTPCPGAVPVASNHLRTRRSVYLRIS